jgi:minor extracellular serine protease Vpr
LILKINGVNIRSEIGEIVTATIPLDRLTSIAALPSVVRIESSIRCTPLLDISIPAIGVDSVWDGYSGIAYEGEGSIIGIYDSGIDWSHPDFIDESGNSRILFLWDQTDNTDINTTSFAYGTEYNRSQINDKIDGMSVGLVQGKDHTGHGTHVAGIAAGNGRGTGNDQPSGVYKGVAPKADLIIVKGGNEFFNSDSIVDGINYIFQKAEALDPSCPVVVNLSVGGTHYGPHDGTSLYEKSLTNLLYENGRAIVVASGNEGDDPIHFMGELYSTYKDSLLIEFEVINNNPDERNDLYFDIWYEPELGLELIIEMPDQTRLDTVSTGEILTWPGDGAPMVYVSNEQNVHSNGDREIYIHISDRQNESEVENFQMGIWQLIFIGKWGRFDGWMYDKTVTAIITTGVDYTTLIAEPGNAHSVITVGSYTSRDSWPSLYQDPYHVTGLSVGELSSFSSPGPPRPNSAESSPQNKPEISAPGTYILSTLSNQMSWPDDQWVAMDSVHWALSGTSMAAPHVAGVAALLFEADLNASASTIENWIIASAKRDIYTGHAGESYYWDLNWGFGKLNAYQAILETDVEKEVGVVMPETFYLYQNVPNPFNQKTVIRFNISDKISRTHQEIDVVINDLQGREIRIIRKEFRTSGQYQVEWDGRNGESKICASGVYLYRLKIGDYSFCRKMILLR